MLVGLLYVGGYYSTKCGTTIQYVAFIQMGGVKQPDKDSTDNFGQQYEICGFFSDERFNDFLLPGYSRHFFSCV